jgi:hypothetical protein
MNKSELDKMDRRSAITGLLACDEPFFPLYLMYAVTPSSLVNAATLPKYCYRYV